MKKNVVIFHTDQQRYDSLGCNGNEEAKTPHIDALAEVGTRFTRHITANPTCMPSRASLFTGLYVPGHGVTSNGIPLWRREVYKSDALGQNFFGVKIEEKVPTLADRLLEEGYATSLFGKLHLEPHLSDGDQPFYENYKTWEKEDTVLLNQGFYGFETKKMVLGHGEAPCGYNRGHYGRWLNENHPDMVAITEPGGDAKTSLPGERDDIYLSKLPSKYHNTTWLAQEACQYIENKENHEKPMFMFVGFPDPHHPFTPPEDISGPFMTMDLPDFADKSEMKGDKPSAIKRAIDQRSASKSDCLQAYKNTMASIYLIDQAVGRVINTLKEQGLYDDTIIIFTSDHGDYLGDLDMLAKSDLPFKNLTHVPFILKGTKDMSLPPVMNLPMSNVDVFPTLLSLLGIESDQRLQGVDIFDPNSIDNTPMVTCFGITGDERNITLFDQNYRYSYYLDTKEEELYDHRTDEKELHNLAMDPDVATKELCSSLKGKLFAKHVDCDLGVYNHYALW
jgi:arylsulfatase A-like enzyme